MSKLYVFGIGGTGSRVLKALTMLFAAGVDSNNYDIVPIIIDPDSAAGDLTRTVEIMRCYQSIRSTLRFGDDTRNCFFKANIQDTIENFHFELNDTTNMQFKEYIGFNSMSRQNQAIVDLLFSKKNLDSDMIVGFKGNPNIGSVVLNQISESDDLQQFANQFQQGDKIFIISSIFGGTGASGFPLLTKILRSNNQIPNYALINDAPIGAVTVLPYFGLKKDDNSEIDSSTFISKTKSAISYYLHNISNNNSVDTLYYVADSDWGQYDNCEGGANQTNDAHFVELAAALSIIDFLNDGERKTKTVHKEFGIDGHNRSISLMDLSRGSSDILTKKMIQFFLLCEYIQHTLSQKGSSDFYKRLTWTRDRNFGTSFWRNPFILNLLDIEKAFFKWLKEMQNNNNSSSTKFAPFALEENKSLFDTVIGKEPNKLKCFTSNYELFDSFLNKEKTDKHMSQEQQFMELFYNATTKLINKKFNL